MPSSSSTHLPTEKEEAPPHTRVIGIELHPAFRLALPLSVAGSGPGSTEELGCAAYCTKVSPMTQGHRPPSPQRLFHRKQSSPSTTCCYPKTREGVEVTRPAFLIPIAGACALGLHGRNTKRHKFHSRRVGHVPFVWVLEITPNFSFALCGPGEGEARHSEDAGLCL